ncbi:MAG: ParA family protein [Candidatus Latescibacterota bacterium]|nr:MAG: ParA family protein [Candidatus Latescibacterota bacterium]
MRKTETVAFLSQKGGVGKTTSVVNIGAGLAILGERVLLIDFDPQAHLTHSLRILDHEVRGTIYEVIRGEASVEDVVVRRRLGAKIRFADREGELSVGVIPSNLSLAGAEATLANVRGKECLLRDVLAEYSGEFDGILIDCPPSLGLLAVNALVAATKVVIPVQAEYLALESLDKLEHMIDVVRKRLNPGLELAGIIVTRYDGRKILNREIVAELQEKLGGVPFETTIRENIALAEAPRCGADIFTYRPRSHGAEDYLHLCEEILHRNRKQDEQKNENIRPPDEQQVSEGERAGEHKTKEEETGDETTPE